MITTLTERMRGLASLFWREVAKFGAVGGVAFVIDNGLTYYLMHGPMTDSEAKARFVGASIATVFSWIANRFWTFRHRRQDNVLREFLMFILINGIGIGISTGFTALAKYGFGVTDKNMLFAAGVVGILVATVVRFFAYRFLVFNQELDQEPEFSHDHEIIERHPPRRRHGRSPASPAAAVKDPELPGPPGLSTARSLGAGQLPLTRSAASSLSVTSTSGCTSTTEPSLVPGAQRLGQGRFQAVRRRGTSSRTPASWPAAKPSSSSPWVWAAPSAAPHGTPRCFRIDVGP